MARNSVPIDAAVLRDALDGRPLRWLATRAGVHEQTIYQRIAGGKPLRFRPATYAKLRAALPALPPPPDAATNDHDHAPTVGAK